MSESRCGFASTGADASGSTALPTGAGGSVGDGVTGAGFGAEAFFG
ncbi:MAG: hypothetical protein ACR2NP_07965 [Pirellulaceae bacterium]